MGSCTYLSLGVTLGMSSKFPQFSSKVNWGAGVTEIEVLKAVNLKADGIYYGRGEGF